MASRKSIIICEREDLFGDNRKGFIIEQSQKIKREVKILFHK